MKTETEDAVIAATQQWLERAVIGLNLCPFAKAVHVKQQIRYVVSTAQTPDELLAELATELSRLDATAAAEIDTTLLIAPQMFEDFIDFHFFLEEADVLLKRSGLEGVIQIASFHPKFEFAGSEADDIANYSNRSPYPILHLLREASIDRAVAAFPDAADIYERNIETLEQLGHDGWQRLFKKLEAQ
ncbi:MAG TPA: DUF1415 domain-containing protein [Rhodocyclaceae bacterium]|nr:DUF1415 domain-containing protein [Rhodocyclaceae bacterium]